ncbi:unnamed protein product, partial [marine sediment metagenome]
MDGNKTNDESQEFATHRDYPKLTNYSPYLG